MSSSSNGSERRRCERIRLQVPLFVRGANLQGAEFVELAKTVDISGRGARLVISGHLRIDELISLTIPAPLPRSADFGDCGTPTIQARVRRIEDRGDLEIAAVEFLKPLD